MHGILLDQSVMQIKGGHCQNNTPTQRNAYYFTSNSLKKGTLGGGELLGFSQFYGSVKFCIFFKITTKLYQVKEG